MSSRPQLAAQMPANRGQKVTIQWVPSHGRIEGNGRAGQVAKRAVGRYSRDGMTGLWLAYVRRMRKEDSEQIIEITKAQDVRLES
jgi:hypothetical protein